MLHPGIFEASSNILDKPAFIFPAFVSRRIESLLLVRWNVAWKLVFHVFFPLDIYGNEPKPISFAALY